MKGKLIAEHQFVADCAGLLEECSGLDNAQIAARHGEFCRYVLKLGAGVASFVGGFVDKGKIGEDWVNGIMAFVTESFNTGYDYHEKTPKENAVTSAGICTEFGILACGVAYATTPGDAPLPDSNRVKAAFENGLREGLEALR